MAITHGMNVDSVKSIARGLDQQANSLDRVLQDAGRALGQAESIWRGNDRASFSARWTGVHRPALIGLRDDLRHLAKRAQDNAAAQERHSDHLMATAGSSSDGTGGGAGPLTPELLDVWRQVVGGKDAELQQWLDDSGLSSANDILRFFDNVLSSSVAKNIADFGPLKYANLAADTVAVTNDLTILFDGTKSFEDRFFAFTDATSKIIDKMGPVGQLGSMSIDIWTFNAQMAMETDWSAQGFEDFKNGLFPPGTDYSPQGIADTFTYAWQHPGETGEAFNESIYDLWGWKFWPKN